MTALIFICPTFINKCQQISFLKRVTSFRHLLIPSCRKNDNFSISVLPLTRLFTEKSRHSLVRPRYTTENHCIIGIYICQLTEGYGQTEATCAVTFQMYNDPTAGLTLPTFCFRLFCLFVRFLFDWLAMLVRLLTGASVYMFAALEAFRLFAMFFPSLLSALLSICSFCLS